MKNLMLSDINYNSYELLFTTEDYDESDLLIEDLKYILSGIKYMSQKKEDYVFLSKRKSRYGYISNHGRSGFTIQKNKTLADAIVDIANSGGIESFEVLSSKKDGTLLVIYYDHDGTHNSLVSKVKNKDRKIIENILSHLGFQEALDKIQHLNALQFRKGFLGFIKK